VWVHRLSRTNQIVGLAQNLVLDLSNVKTFLAQIHVMFYDLLFILIFTHTQICLGRRMEIFSIPSDLLQV
jgi:hypothetical protein